LYAIVLQRHASQLRQGATPWQPASDYAIICFAPSCGGGWRCASRRRHRLRQRQTLSATPRRYEPRHATPPVGLPAAPQPFALLVYVTLFTATCSQPRRSHAPPASRHASSHNAAAAQPRRAITPCHQALRITMPLSAPTPHF